MSWWGYRDQGTLYRREGIVLEPHRRGFIFRLFPQNYIYENKKEMGEGMGKNTKVCT